MMNRDNTNSQDTSLEIERTRAMSTTARAIPVKLLPRENSDIKVDVHRLLRNGDEWLQTPNGNFGERAPIELIGTEDEYLVRETLRAAVHSGMA